MSQYVLVAGVGVSSRGRERGKEERVGEECMQAMCRLYMISSSSCAFRGLSKDALRRVMCFMLLGGCRRMCVVFLAFTVIICIITVLVYHAVSPRGDHFSVTKRKTASPQPPASQLSPLVTITTTTTIDYILRRDNTLRPFVRLRKPRH